MADYKVKITENEYLPLRDVVFNTIKDGILTGKLKPGITRPPLFETKGASGSVGA